MSELILLESVSARNEKLAKLTQDASLDHLNTDARKKPVKVKD